MTIAGVGYDVELPCLHPFMYIEHQWDQGTESPDCTVEMQVLAFGAYEAYGLIGPEKGGVAVVVRNSLPGTQNFVISTMDFPYDPAGRHKEFLGVVSAIQSAFQEFGDDVIGARRAIVKILKLRAHDTRI